MGGGIAMVGCKEYSAKLADRSPGKTTGSQGIRENSRGKVTGEDRASKSRKVPPASTP